MAKYLQESTSGNGDYQEVQPITSTAGAADAGKIAQTDANGQWHPSLIPNINTITFTASEAIAAGALINIYDSGSGVVRIRNATNAGAGTRAHGYAPAAIAASASGTVYLTSGLISGLSGLTPGAQYVLGTAGGLATAIPTATGSIAQPVGVAKSATELSFNAGPVTVRA
ncbi:hypothetical protein DAETH_29130 [Deinococcus aetherius]|uniref:Uncharacterized protein n=1 Tax=Deinococcus aetherius TaxID=200252 RepID=A0ABN6RM39_9DEIO|nr:hypothetical protein [Deinococcus aetherius]BDP42944.1 hypothetical protein DAETH_29130 [Deinococcus aetherius]